MNSAVNSQKTTGRNSTDVVTTASLTPAAAMLKRRLGTSPAPRMLTPSEIELLRRSVEEAAEVAGAFFERSEGDSKA